MWAAHTGVAQTNFRYPHGIWQYSHTGKIAGINGSVDLNYGYIDYPRAMKTAGRNGFSKNDKEQAVTHKEKEMSVTHSCTCTKECPLQRAIEMIGGKWKPAICVR